MSSSCQMALCWFQTIRRERFIESAIESSSKKILSSLLYRFIPASFFTAELERRGMPHEETSAHTGARTEKTSPARTPGYLAVTARAAHRRTAA
jgi:hypothetical protein